MLFLKKHGWWVLSIVLGVCISVGILAYRSKDEVKVEIHGTERQRSETADSSKGSFNVSTPKKFRKVTESKTTHDHDKNLGSIFSASTHSSTPPLLPSDIQTRLDEIYQEMRITNTFFEIRNGEKVVTEAAYKRLYDALVSGMSPEEAVVFLETYQIYNPIILDKLEPLRAIGYLYKVRARWIEKESYARNVLIRDPGNIDARMVLLSAEPDDSAAVAGYRDIVTRDPGNINALIGLGYRLHYDYPDEAIQYLKKVNSLDATRGLFSLGLAYERLGDLKTAWLYYRKQQTIQNGDIVVLHKRSIERGTPLYAPVPLSSAELPVLDEASIGITADPHEATHVHDESSTWQPEFASEERSSSEDQLMTDAARREAARAEAEGLYAAEQQVLTSF